MRSQWDNSLQSATQAKAQIYCDQEGQAHCCEQKSGDVLAAAAWGATTWVVAD
eukprot:m.83100 g.83100  ORF g.83100 m.83100 type:complete len:53 (-) comp11174_c0_seq1:89-247(-)